MSANAMVRKHLKPLLARFPDLVIIGRMIMVKPIRHVLRGIGIASVDHDRYFVSRWSMTHLCQPFPDFPSDWGERILRGSPGLRFWDDPQECAWFVQQLERDVLPVLRSVQTLDDLVEQIQIPVRVPFRNTEIDELRGVTLHAARGDLDQARRHLDILRSGRSWYCQPPWEKHTAAVVSSLGPLLDADDRVGIARQLAEWETTRISRMPKGYARIWTPTPFPIEARSD